jgi:hypothetical protein
MELDFSNVILKFSENVSNESLKIGLNLSLKNCMKECVKWLQTYE